jgi:hypothetical protein
MRCPGVGETVPVGVAVGVDVGSRDAVIVGVGVRVAVGVDVGGGVPVGVGVTVGLAVRVTVGVDATLTGAENSEVLPWPSVAVAVTLGPVSPASLLKVKLPAPSAVVKPS